LSTAGTTATTAAIEQQPLEEPLDRQSLVIDHWSHWNDNQSLIEQTTAGVDRRHWSHWNDNRSQSNNSHWSHWLERQPLESIDGTGATGMTTGVLDRTNHWSRLTALEPLERQPESSIEQTAGIDRRHWR